jgi:hypothetical protein
MIATMAEEETNSPPDSQRRPPAAPKEIVQDYNDIPTWGPNITLTKLNPRGHQISVTLQLSLVWGVFDAVQRLGLRQAIELINFGGWVTTNLGTLQTDPEGTEATRLRDIAANDVMTSLVLVVPDARLEVTDPSRVLFHYTEWPSPDDRLLSFCYYLLRDKQINRIQAAEFASWVREKEGRGPVLTEAWRKRVDRWAGQHGLPQIGKPRPRHKRQAQAPH